MSQQIHYIKWFLISILLEKKLQEEYLSFL